MNKKMGRRYCDEPKLNLKKVFAVIIAIIVFIMVIVSIVNLLNKKENINNQMQVPKKYFTIYENEKYGVIDGEGNIILKPTYDEMIIIPDNAKPIFICIYNVDYPTETYKTKVLNEKGEEILKNYSNISPIENSNNNEIWYEKDVLTFEKNGLYGLVNFSGKEIIPAEYSKIYALNGVQKSIVIEKNGLKGVLNTSLSSVVLECNYKDISLLDKNNADNGYIVNKDGKYGVVSATGTNVLECNYSEIKNVSGNDMYVVKEDNKYKVIDINLNVIKDSGFDDILEINGDYITFELNDLKGVVNSQGLEIIPVQYEDLKYSFDNYFIAKNNGSYGIISTDNIVMVDFAYENIDFINKANLFMAENTDYTTNIISRDFKLKLSNVIISELNIENAYMRIRKQNEYKYYNFNFEEKKNVEILSNQTLFLVKKDGKYGYINKSGELIVNYIYDDAKEQNEFGFCAVKQNGKWGALGKDGTVIVKPSIDLENNLYIDFISKWHIYNDLNLNLYVK